ncbi:hypothetical protein BY458DRAFT_556023 [Sporodiniella umbellata]|nr:hypothetical protein BY458DRAFT_556023 [Sporodiniella umbellata]
MNEDNSEQDYISKLYAPIMESCFHGSGIRLRWGDTIPLVCNKSGYGCKIDMRVTIPAKKPLDLSVVEYAKKLFPSKYYKDKVKTVLCSAIYHRNYQKESSNIKVPAMLIARLENELLLYYQIDSNWCVIEKVEDADVPNSVQAIKEGAIKAYVNSIKYFKDFCIDMKNSLRKTVSMKAITKPKRSKMSHTQKPLWFSTYKCDDSDDDLSEERY